MHALRALPAALLLAVVLAACGSSSTPAGSRTVGAGIEHNLQAGWNAYKFQDLGTIERQLGAAIRRDPTMTQVGAIEAAYVYAQRLDLQQRLERGDEQRLARFMEHRFPAAGPVLRRDLG